ncbi:MAG: hypothetical protein ACRENP_13310 [Longimicrobiales bacterium]
MGWFGRIVNGLIAASIRHRAIVIAATLALALAGIWAFATLLYASFGNLRHALLVMLTCPLP